MPNSNNKLLKIYGLLSVVMIMAILVKEMRAQRVSYRDVNADILALAINAANEEVQMKLEKPISIENYSLYYSDRYASDRDTFFNAITYSNKFTSPCYKLSVKLAEILRTNSNVFGISDLDLRDRKLWLKYRSSKFFK